MCEGVRVRGKWAREKERRHKEWENAMNKASAEWERAKIEHERATKILEQEKQRQIEQDRKVQIAEEQLARKTEEAEHALRIAHELYDCHHSQK